MEKEVEKCINMIRRGYTKEKIRAVFKWKNFEDIYEVAKCRIRAKNKFSVKSLYFDTYGLRYSTPEIVAEYRAKRIQNKKIADISCGVGLQAIFYSFKNKRVLCVDINKKRIEYAKKNAIAYKANNIDFLIGDALSDEIKNRVAEYDVIFSDPARDESEPERSLETLLPSPIKIIEKYGQRDYIFDLPPQIALHKIPKDWEKEFISLNGKIIRFTAYVGKLKIHDRVAVSLPENHVLWSDLPPQHLNYKKLAINKIKLSNNIYIVGESIYYAKLLNEFKDRYHIQYLQIGKRRTLATGDGDIPFTKKFKVLCKSTNLSEIIECMKSEGIGKVTLRFAISPEEYWSLRTKLENALRGELKGSLFHVGDVWIGATNVT